MAVLATYMSYWPSFEKQFDEEFTSSPIYSLKLWLNINISWEELSKEFSKNFEFLLFPL